MNELLDSLCTVLEDELERQETVLAVCRAQRDAVLAHDLEHVEAKTGALEILIREAVQAQGLRGVLLRQIVDYYELPVERQTLSGLIGVSPDPWKTRLQELQRGLRAVLHEIRIVVRSNAAALRKSLHIVEQSLSVIESVNLSPAAAYDARGGEPARTERSAALIDQRG